MRMSVTNEDWESLFVWCGTQHTLPRLLRLRRRDGKRNLLVPRDARLRRTCAANSWVTFPSQMGTHDGADCDDFLDGMRRRAPEHGSPWRGGF